VSGYVRPCDDWVSNTWQDHKNRTPPSSEPGTDYAAPYGTDLAIAESGTVRVIDHSNGGGEGRRCSVDLDDGRRVSYIHLSAINAYHGQRVARGQTGVIWSGASGHGSDWGYDPHVHVSLWEAPGMPYAQTIDFDALVEKEDEDLNADQDNMLRNIYAAVFDGGVSMPDGGRSIGQSLADITAGTRPVVNRADADGVVHPNTWIQELADVKTAQLDQAGPTGLTRPAWLIGFLLGLIGLFEVVRLVVDLIV
jgi:murein DD-endopeptidase MepM/ murein hydrolase activator NlpD